MTNNIMEEVCVCGHSKAFHFMFVHQCLFPGSHCDCKKFQEPIRCYKCLCILGKNGGGFLDGLQRTVCARCMEEDNDMFSDEDLKKWLEWEDVDPVSKEDLLKRYEKVLKSNKQDEIEKVKKKIIEVFGFAQ